MQKTNHNVQTPGQTAEPETTAEVNAQAEITAESTQQSQPDAAPETQDVQLVAAEKKSSKASKGAATAAEEIDYSKMRAADIDPTKLTTSVLSADGWVLPNPQGK